MALAVIVFIFKAVWKIVFFFMKLLLPVNEKKITFLSKQTDDPPLDFLLLRESLLKRDEDLNIVFLLKTIKVNPIGLIGYYLYIYYMMYHIATSKVCVLDGYVVPICTLKQRDELFVLQIWHALGAVKKFGYQIQKDHPTFLNRLATLMDNHRNYDMVISGSEEMIPYFAEAFDMPKEKFKAVGAPKIDNLYEKEATIREAIYRKYPHLRSDKKIILYAPTFRRDNDYRVNELIDNIDFDKYILIVKMHPNLKQFNAERIENCRDFSSFRLLTVSDVVITDYSAVSMEAAALDRPVYFYLYDYDKYKKDNGLNVDFFKEMPDVTFKNAKDLIKKIESNTYDYDRLNVFRNKYVGNVNHNATKEITDIIMDKINNK